MLRGIDISEHQGDINLSALKDQVDFIIIRAGYSTTVDKKFERNYALCKQLGIPVGAYWYSYALTLTDAIYEADAFLKALKGKQFEYPVYLDMEDADHYKVNHGYDFVNTKPISQKFCEIVESAGYYTGIYASKSWFDNYLAGLQSKYTSWVAHWGSNDGNVNVDYSNSVYGMHQYASTARLNGYGGNLDINLSFVDFPATIKAGGFNGFGQGGSTEPTPEPTPTGKYKVGDHVKFGTCFRTSLDASTCNPSLTVRGMLTDNGVVSDVRVVNGVTVYNLSNICWVNDGDITGFYSIQGAKVIVTNPVDINGTRLAVSGTYDVMEVQGSRVVIGRDGVVTAAIDVNNIKIV